MEKYWYGLRLYRNTLTQVLRDLNMSRTWSLHEANARLAHGKAQVHASFTQPIVETLKGTSTLTTE